MNLININLKNCRKKAKLSVQEVSEILKTSEDIIQRYESGKLNPDIGVLQRFAHIYKVDVNDVLYGDRKSILLNRMCSM